MSRIAVVTDSSANLPEELVKEYGIEVVPIRLLWNGKDYRDGIDITSQELYRRLRIGNSLPKTAAPSVGDFLQAYLRVAKRADEIFSIHIPPSFSAIYELALTASKLVEDVKIHVINGRSAAAGLGLVVLEAARAIRRGASSEEVLRRIEYVSSRVHVFAALDTLKYLYYGGRIGLAATLAGFALNLKPVLYVKDGTVDVWAKPRTRKRAICELVKVAERKTAGKKAHVIVMHGDALDDALHLRDELLKHLDCVEIFITEFTPVMGAHTGPGLLGVAFWAEDGE